MVTTLLQHFVTTLLILLAWGGAGVMIIRRGRLRSAILTNTSAVQAVLAGFIAWQVAATLLLTYLPLRGMEFTFAALTIVAWCCGLASIGRSIRSEPRTAGRTAAILALTSLVSFAGSYIAFLPAEAPFLASQGGGDHTLYLGMPKYRRMAASGHWLAESRLRSTLQYAASISHWTDPETRSWMESMLGVDQLPYVAEVTTDPWGFESTERTALMGFNPGWWSLPSWVLCGSDAIAPETLYLSLLFAMQIAMTAALGLLVYQTTGRWFVAAVGAILLNLSAGFASVPLDHYYLQWLAILASLALAEYCVGQLLAERGDMGQDIVALSACSAASLSLYWPCVPWIGAIAGLYSIIRVQQRRERPPLEWLQPSRLALTIAIAFSASHWLSYWLTVNKLLSGSRRILEQSWAYLGAPVTTWEQGIASVTGVAVHTLLQPFTQATISDFAIGHYGHWLAGGLVGAICLGLGLTFASSVRTGDIRTSLGKPANFAAMLVLPMLFATVLSRTYAYTFDKAACMTLPFLLLSTCAGGHLLIGEGRRLRRWTGGIALAVLLSGWGIVLVDARAYQVLAFWSEGNRSRIVYTDVAGVATPIAAASVTKERSPTFYYSDSNTTLALVDSVVTGNRPIPANGYSGFPSYAPLVPHDSEPVFIGPSGLARQYQRMSAESFRLPESDVKVWPFGPLYDSRNSALPHTLLMGSPGTLELVIETSEPLFLSCAFCPSLSASGFEACQIGSRDIVDFIPHDAPQGFPIERDWNLPVEIRVFRLNPAPMLATRRYAIRLDGIYGVHVRRITDHVTPPPELLTQSQPRLDLPTVNVAWDRIPKPSPQDWIGLYSAGSTPESRLDFTFTTGAPTGQLSFRLASQLLPQLSTGEYEFRLYSAGGWKLLATSPRFAFQNVVPVVAETESRNEKK